MRIFIALISIVTSAGNIFLYCYVGTLTTVQFLRFSDVVYESIWYKFPVKLQKYLRLIIADAHRPRAFDGFGIMDLNLVAFAKVFYPLLKLKPNCPTSTHSFAIQVMKSAISFYLMIKTFAE